MDQRMSNRVLGKWLRRVHFSYFTVKLGSQVRLRVEAMQGQVHVAVRKLLAYYGDKVGSITVTGHSLGGALATMCAFDIVRRPPFRWHLSMVHGTWAVKSIRICIYQHLCCGLV